MESQPTEEQAVEDDGSEEPSHKRPYSETTGVPPGIVVQARENLAIPKSARSSRLDQFVSPTKSILLTPGTAATRRKTVSFSARKEIRGHVESPDNPVELEGTHTAKVNSESGRAPQPPRKQSALTKTLIELSTKRSSPPTAAIQLTESTAQNLSIKLNDGNKISEPQSSEPVVDFTIDLSQPRSRSGQHWKAEYEEYHRNSSREMKKIIQYGQNVKSYAVKKDYEATTLNEKLQNELVKAARMETKVSKLAKQLKTANAQGPQGDSGQARLIGELAQQTAMGVKYQKRAEQYRKAISRRSSTFVSNDQSIIMDDSLPEAAKDPSNSLESLSKQTELQNLREAAVAAEKRAAKLEDENIRLKRNLARVKEEMTTYDSRRKAKEERLKKREERHKASKEQYEAELAKLKVEYHMLLQASEIYGKGLQQNVPPIRNFLTNETGNKSLILQDTKDDAVHPSATAQQQTQQPSSSPPRNPSQKPAVDIWTATSPNNNPERHASPSNKAKPLAPPPLEPDIPRALLEIDRNRTTPQPSSPPATKPPKAQLRSENIRQATPKPFPKRDIVDDSIKIPSSRQQLHQSTVGRSASLLSNRVGASRTSTMGSTRTSSLSAERAAAAKARLAERKRSGGDKRKKEKMMMMEEKIGSLRESEVF